MADPKTKALQLNIEGLLRLLGGTPAQRLRFWEIFKGITTPAEFRLMNMQLDNMAATVKQLGADAKALQATAAQIAKQGK